ncbi:MAG: MgtC/SapB family protein [Tissierellia bacterium]|nr:MgtC/SapB family protein [Tissierellia bacterium]
MLDSKQVFIRLILSILLSGIIGIDRESTNKPAGLRTHILVSLGATLMMLLSLHFNSMYRNGITMYTDRMAAQVISGIGFLGAGTILRRDKGIITGLTTAASLWVVAAIGLAVGAGFYLGAVLTTIFTVITLITFQKVSKKFRAKGQYLASLRIISVDKPGIVGKIGQVLGEHDVNILSINIEHIDADLISINLEVAMKELKIKYDLLNTIASIEDIVEVSQRS